VGSLFFCCAEGLWPVDLSPQIPPLISSLHLKSSRLSCSFFEDYEYCPTLDDANIFSWTVRSGFSHSTYPVSFLCEAKDSPKPYQ